MPRFAGTRQRPHPFKQKMAPRGAIPVSALVVVVAMLDDRHPVRMMPPTLVPAVIAMLTEFGTGAVAVMVAMLDHDGVRAGN